MNISYNWLKTILPIDLPSDFISEILTDIGLEVEKTYSYCNIPGALEGLIVGEVTNKQKHPNADKLSITEVNIGAETHQIICGAPNVAVGQKVVVALPGTTIYPTNGDPFKINKAKIRGEVSHGMICGEDEIGLGDNHDGILILNKTAKVGSFVKELYEIEEDVVFEIGLTPNRADSMGHFGVARDLLVALKYRGIISKDTKLNENTDTIKSSDLIQLKIEVENTSSCPRYAGVAINNISVTESPSWLKNKLKAIGLNPINNIVDITNYILHEYGQPLHAFDLSKIDGHKIVVRNAKANTEFTTLDNEKRTLDKDDLMICNENEGMCIAGVFGGVKSGVTDETTAVFIESAYFNPYSIRKTAKRHGLNTDASFRFERGVDPNMIIPALEKATAMILQLAGGEVASPVYDEYPEPIDDFVFSISPKKINLLCGIDLSTSKMIEILELLHINILENKNDLLKIKVPSYRVDVQREADIAEEILRIHGFNEVPVPEKLNASLQLQNSNINNKIKNKVSNQLVALGLNEILSNSLTRKDYVASLQSKELDEQEHIELLNPLSSDTNVLRQSLIFNALEVVHFNQKNGKQNVHVFEFGKIYQLKNNQPKEEERLLIALSGLQNEEHWYNSKTSVSFYQLKGIVEQLFASIGFNKIHYRSIKNDLYNDGLEIHIGKELMGYIGYPSKDICQQINLKNEVFIADIFWEKLLKVIDFRPTNFRSINKYPKVYRDLSLLINEEVSFDDLKTIAFKVDSSILRDIQLFDIYKGKNLAANKKSYALRFELHNDAKTLNDKEIDNVMVRIQKKLISSFNAELR